MKPQAEQLAAALDEALGLLREYPPAGDTSVTAAADPSALLEECLALCTQAPAVRPEPIRTVHHLACTGGTLICKCLAAMPNTQLLSEVEPLSELQWYPKPIFAPTDMITLMRQSTRGVSTDLVVKLFLGSLELIYAEANRLGQRLVLRGHAHSHFCAGDGIPGIPTLPSIVAEKFPVTSLVTVRHPLDSFLSLKLKGWLHFRPATFDEYCRRYLAFLRAYGDFPVIRYEDFVDSPGEVMARICDHLELPFSEDFLHHFSVFRLTGDSGRSGDTIESRPRRPLDPALLEEIDASPDYRTLLELMGYENQ